MSIDSAVNDDLESGSPAFKFDEIGDTLRGTVTSGQKRQQTDFKTKEPKFYKDGNPMYQYVIGVQPADGSDPVRLFAKGQMWSSLKEQITSSTAGKLEVGGEIVVRFDSTIPTDASPQKIYKTKYSSPAASAAVDDFDDL